MKKIYSLKQLLNLFDKDFESMIKPIIKQINNPCFNDTYIDFVKSDYIKDIKEAYSAYKMGITDDVIEDYLNIRNEAIHYFFSVLKAYRKDD